MVSCSNPFSILADIFEVSTSLGSIAKDLMNFIEVLDSTFSCVLDLDVSPDIVSLFFTSSTLILSFGTPGSSQEIIYALSSCCTLNAALRVAVVNL